MKKLSLIDFIFKGKYGTRFLIINILFIISPSIYNFIKYDKLNIESIIIFGVYLISYCLSYISVKQYNEFYKINEDGNYPLKMFSFTISALIIIVISIVNIFMSNEIDMKFIFSNAIFNFVAFIFLFSKSNNDVKFSEKVKMFAHKMKWLFFDKEKSKFPIFRGIICIIAIIILLYVAITFTSLKMYNYIF